MCLPRAPGTWSGVGRARGVQADGRGVPGVLRAGAEPAGVPGRWALGVLRARGPAPRGHWPLCGTLITLSGSPGLLTAEAPGLPGSRLMGRSRPGGLSRVSRPEPIRAQSALPQSCQESPRPAPGVGVGGLAGARGGVTTRQVSSGMRLPWRRGWGGGPFANEVLSVRVTVALATPRTALLPPLHSGRLPPGGNWGCVSVCARGGCAAWGGFKEVPPLLRTRWCSVWA